MPASNLENLETAVEGFLAKETNPTPAGIRELIERFRIIDSCSVDGATAELLAEIAAERGIQTIIDSKLERYTELDPEALEVPGGDEFWQPPLRGVDP